MFKYGFIEGSLKKVSADSESAHQRYFILFNDMLLYCKVRNPNEMDQKGSLVCSCVFPLRHCVAEAVVGDGLFKVTFLQSKLKNFTQTFTFLGNLQRRVSSSLFQYC